MLCGMPMVAMSVVVGLAAPAALARQWTPTTPLPDQWAGHQLVAGTGHLYHIGGLSVRQGIEGAHRVFYAAIDQSGTVGTWIQGESLPEGVTYHAAAVSNGTLFVLGGLHYDGQQILVSSKMYYSRLNADGIPGVWHETTSLLSAGYFLGAAVWNERIYVAGGTDYQSAAATVASAAINADGSLGAWRIELSLPVDAFQHAAVAVNGALYVLGGYINNGMAIQSRVYYSLINSGGALAGWSSTAPLPFPLAALGAATTCGRLYVTGGDTGTIFSQQTLWADVMPDHTLSAWSALPPLPQPRYLHGMASTDRFAFVSGGYDAQSAYQSTAYVMPLPADATVPAITQQPANQTVESGESASFSITATGRAPLTYHWRKDGVNLIDGGNISGAMTATLTSNPVQASDAGVYDVLVINSCGSAQSEPATLIVTQPCPPDINNSGQVDVDDLIAVILSWGCTNPPGPCPADIDDSGTVDVDDLIAVILAWGPCP